MAFKNFFFIVLFVFSLWLFFRNLVKIAQGIKKGQPFESGNDKLSQFKNMMKVAFGQSKMRSRPISAMLHAIVYVGFFIINVETFEMVIDGILGTHRFFSDLSFYGVLTATYEVLAVLIIIAVLVFWIRRNIFKINRFNKKELSFKEKRDANVILYFELFLMGCFLNMNGADYALQELGVYKEVGYFPIIQTLEHLYMGFSVDTLMFLERVGWWGHIIGIFIFLNYLYYSKHLHILFAFPNTFFANLQSFGKWGNNSIITNEVKLIMGLSQETQEVPPQAKFGAEDVFDLTQRQLLNAYTCTECGRCTDECPANKTGKLLSPRKVMMDTRDRMEEILSGKEDKENNTLLHNYITTEEIWACTTCVACVEACPIDINPMSILMDMRQFLVMEQSNMPVNITTMMTCLENNGAPWAYNQANRFDWAKN